MPHKPPFNQPRLLTADNLMFAKIPLATPSTLTSLTSSIQTTFLFFNFSKAFDIENLQLTIHKLHNIGIQASFCHAFSS